MTLKKIARAMASIVRGRMPGRHDKTVGEDLDSVERIIGNADNVRRRSDLSLTDLFTSREIESLWEDSEKEIRTFAIPDGTGGVNPGDRRAVYYLIAGIKPSSVLEIGTHIGASTLHIASALYRGQINSGGHARLTTVDIADVNDPVTKPWLKYGTNHSPREMIDSLGYGSFVEFVTDTSLGFAARCDRRFDFIFLDGDHSARTVYQEIPTALRLLNPNGIILLHDYFPEMKPLWSDGSVLPGPFLGAQRLINEGADLTVCPLGKLPWPTKLQSNVTSLALLLRNG